MYKIVAILFFITVISGCILAGQYRPSELCVIEWGSGENQLLIQEPYREYSDDINGDTIGFMEHGNGPGMFFMDKNDNVYIKSSSLRYLKIFRPDGTYFLDYSPGNTSFDYGSYFGRGISDFYVDSLCRLYADGIYQNYIAIVDTSYKLIDKISPIFIDSTEHISIANWGSHDILSLVTAHSGCITYREGRFDEGGTFYGWLANDNYYYYVMINDDSVLYASRFSTPVSNCYADSYDSLFSFDMREIIGCSLLGVTDSMLLCIGYRPCIDSLNSYICFYDTTGKIIDQFMLLPQVENHYLYYIYEPFFRADGCIFQFLCEDDGLHVIKWSKQ